MSQDGSRPRNDAAADAMRGMSLQLRDYQVDLIDRIRAQWVRGKRRVLVVLPTGGGKTVVCSAIAKRAVDNGKRVLALAHRSELIDQFARTLTACGLTVGALCASSQAPPNPFAMVQVASVQTLLARNERPPANLIIADEAHHFSEAADAWVSLLKSYPNAYLIGPTATPERGDGSGLSGCFDSIVIGATVKQLTEAGHLVPCEVLRPDKPLKPGELARNPVDAYIEHASGRRAIVFARSVQLADEYAQEFTRRGVQARSVSGETPWAERTLYLGTFRRGGIRVLTCCYVLTEGFDDPEVSCCILARGCGSAGMYLQCVGRVLRPYPEKKNAVVLDLRGVSHEHGLPEDDREYSLDGVGIRLRDKNSYCPVCGAPRVPPESCGTCGYEPSGDAATKPDTIVGVALKPYFKLRETDNDDMRAARLARWMSDGAAKGYRQGWARAKYTAVYGGNPSATILQKAREIASEKGAA